MDEFLKETRDAQFNARMRRYERDKARKEAEFRHQQQTEVIGMALWRQAEKLPDLARGRGRAGQESLQPAAGRPRCQRQP